jgi:hypothetical protein
MHVTPWYSYRVRAWSILYATEAAKNYQVRAPSTDRERQDFVRLLGEDDPRFIWYCLGLACAYPHEDYRPFMEVYAQSPDILTSSVAKTVLQELDAAR